MEGYYEKDCTTNSGTILDSVGYECGQIGYLEGGSYHSYSTHYSNVSSSGTNLSFPSWGYVRWDSQVSHTGVTVDATVHRGTGTPRTYYNYASVI